MHGVNTNTTWIYLGHKQGHLVLVCIVVFWHELGALENEAMFPVSAMLKNDKLCSLYGHFTPWTYGWMFFNGK